MLIEVIADQAPATAKDFLEVSILVPRLNEAHTLVPAIAKAKLERLRSPREIIVADKEIATEIR